MASIARLTNNSDETDVASLISKDNIFSIPFFQRPYKWKPDRIKQLQEDILGLVDESSDFHFLGAVIVHGRRTNPSDPDVFDVIDGQQRLTTIYLFLCAVVRVLCQNREYDDAAGLFLKYIAINRNLKQLSNARLHSCKEDRAQLNSVIRDVLSDNKLKEKLGSFNFKPLPIVANSKDKGTVKNNYNAMLRFLKAEVDDGGIERIRDIYSCLLNKVTVVQIDIKDPASGPAIFDSLNSRQEPMTIGDLVRNGIFAKVADQEPDAIELIDQNDWQPFYSGFENGSRNFFDSYFFPYGLIKNPNLKKSDIYSYLSKQWQDTDDPSEIISELKEYQNPFMDLMCGTNTTQHENFVAEGFHNFYKMGIPSSTLPFLMKLSQETKVGELDAQTADKINKVIESFLLRRAICGIEPTGLHAVFKRLWIDLDGEITSQKVKAVILDHRTVSWPNDSEFEESIRSRPLYGANITPYFLSEYEKSLGGDTPINIPWIEHVLPQKPADGWWSEIDKSSHEALVDTLANLIPLSQSMNQSVGSKVYSHKRDKYSKDSMYKTARVLAKDFTSWNSEKITERASILVKWALERWPDSR
jgi:uncharacterized protein with ParB-like and HNH nuclease domain